MEGLTYVQKIGNSMLVFSMLNPLIPYHPLVRVTSILLYGITQKSQILKL